MAGISLRIGLVLLLAAPLCAQNLPQPAVSAYVIDAELDPATHHLAATAIVSFTAPPATAPIAFALDPALKLTRITDEAGNPLVSERSPGGSLRITPVAPIVAGQSLRLSFAYEGTLTSNGPKLAAIQEPISYLLYAAHWFPVPGDPSNRFTAEMHIRVPQGITVIASGSLGAPKSLLLFSGQTGSQFDFNWTKASFPGTVIAGRFAEPLSAGNVQLYLTASHRPQAADLAQTAAKEFEFFTASFGSPESNHINVVELPDETLPAVWAPELASIPSSRVGDKSGARLLASTIARQWWGLAVSPRSLDDAWITNGMARYSELMFVENESGKSALAAAVQDVAAGALAYDTTPLASASRLPPNSHEFQSVTMEKGAMVFHMLRWELGDKAFLTALQAALRQFPGGTLSSSEFEKTFQAATQQPLTAFFSQWINGTGAPQFNCKYSIFRLGNNQGFRTIGEIGQDLDLFRMPVELSIETDGKTETQKVEVVGADTPFTADTFGRPRKIRIDPQGWLLKSIPELQLRAAILRGQQLTAQGDLNGALDEFQKALEFNAQSSLVNFRIGDALYAQQNYQASATAYRDALSGDGEPGWTEVWSHLALGKIFDITGQRDRAVNEYRLAVQTGDNSQGAVNEAQLYLQKPFQRPEKP